MASKKRKAPSTPSQVRYNQSRFTSQEGWERYTDIIVPRKLLPEKNVVIYHTEFNEIKKELMIRQWDEELTSFDEGNIDVAITPVIVEEGENLYVYSRFALLRPDPQEIAAKLYMECSFYCNLIPTSHTSGITLEKAKLIYGIFMKMDMNVGYHISHQISITEQHDSSRLGFPTLIIALHKARGVQSDSRSLESLSLAINLAYIKKNCWNLDNPTMTFRGPRKARGRRSEAPITSVAPKTAAPSSSIALAPPSLTPAQTVAIPIPFPFQLPALSSSGPSEFLFTPEMLHSMLQSLHRGQPIIM
ncbi:hypothetical protein HKD37_18G050916 [Glycine soja]